MVISGISASMCGGGWGDRRNVVQWPAWHLDPTVSVSPACSWSYSIYSCKLHCTRFRTKWFLFRPNVRSRRPAAEQPSPVSLAVCFPTLSPAQFSHWSPASFNYVWVSTSCSMLLCFLKRLSRLNFSLTKLWKGRMLSLCCSPSHLEPDTCCHIILWCIPFKSVWILPLATAPHLTQLYSCHLLNTACLCIYRPVSAGPLLIGVSRHKFCYLLLGPSEVGYLPINSPTRCLGAESLD